MLFLSYDSFFFNNGAKVMVIGEYIVKQVMEDFLIAVGLD
jgi:hypothetical protein